MKNFTFASLAVVTLTMIAGSSAQAQSSFYGGSYGANTQTRPTPYNNYVLPTSYSNYGTGYGSNYGSNYGTPCPNGRCGTSHAPGYCPTGQCGTSVYRPTTYNTGYGSTYNHNAAYGHNTGTSLGSTFGSWLGLRPRTNPAYGNCANGRCTTSPSTMPYRQPVTNYRPTTPYGSSPYGSTGLYGNTATDSSVFFNN